MNRVKSEGNERVAFEVLDSNLEKVIFKRVILPKGRKQKEIDRIESSFPTLTVKYFNQEDFDNLKNIEKSLHTDLKINEKKTSIIDCLSKWLEIK